MASTATVALLLAWLFHRLRAAGITLLPALLVVALCFVASSHHFHVRPQLVSIVLFAVLYVRLVDFEAGRIGLKALWPLLPLFLIWTNTHGAVVGGLITLALAIGGWALVWLLGRQSPIKGWRDLGLLAALFAGCALTVVVSPYGLHQPRAWTAILQSPELPNLIIEHASLVRTRSFQVLLMAALYLAALIGYGRRLPPITALLPLVWLVLTFQRVRQAPFFAIAATLALAELLPASRWAARLFERREPVPARFTRLPAMLALAGLALVGAAHQLGPRRPVLVHFHPAIWPEALLPALRQEAERLPVGAPVLNDMHLGGLIEYHLPRLRVMVDDRWELFGDDFMLAYFRGDPAWFEDLVRRHDVKLALTQPGSELERYLRGSRWREIARAPAGALFTRANAEH